MGMRTNQFPPRGPRSNHIKLDVTTEERKSLEALAKLYGGCTVVDALKTAAWHELQRLRDHVPTVRREASILPLEPIGQGVVRDADGLPTALYPGVRR